MKELVVIITTTDSIDNVNKISDGLLSLHLVACVQIDKIESKYVWEGKICHDDEYRLFIKTTKEKEEECYHKIKELHSYTTPEIITLKVTNVTDDYLNWAYEVTGNEKI